MPGSGLEEALRRGPQQAQVKNKQPLKVKNPASKEANKKPPISPYQANYEALLGHFLGKKLYRVVAEHFSPNEVMKYSDKAVDQLFKAIEKQGVKYANKSNMSPEDKAGAAAFANALGSYLSDQVKELLKTPKGQEFAKEVSKFTKTHPATILSLALAAAAYAVTSNMKLPQLKQKVHIGKYTTLSASANLGRIRDIALESAEIQLAYSKGLLSTSVKVKGDKDGVKKTHVEAKYGNNEHWVKTIGDLDDKGNLMANIGGGVALNDHTTIEAAVKGKKPKHEQQSVQEVDAKIIYKGKQKTITGGAKYYPKAKKVRLDLETALQQGVDISGFYTQQVNNGKVQRTYGGKAKFTKEDLELALNAQFSSVDSTVKGGVSFKKGHYYGGANAEYNTKLQELSKYYVYFGYKDPKSFEEFLIKYKHEKLPDYSIDDFTAKVQGVIHGLVGTVDLDAQLRDGKFSQGTTSARLAYRMNKDISVFGGVAQGFGPNRQIGTMPMVGVEVKKVPVWVGYDMNSKSVMVGFTFRFGGH